MLTTSFSVAPAQLGVTEGEEEATDINSLLKAALTQGGGPVVGAEGLSGVGAPAAAEGGAGEGAPSSGSTGLGAPLGGVAGVGALIPGSPEEGGGSANPPVKRRKL
uniref:Uncharacterized protein n=1 Tax=Chromera velia CCMP2878 TaxID=1169474 RepID=A0A0G4HQQ5_9ALVE|eukprot:Cvel_30438.t1-p1 / transcript=Cvel_30438.t1 / gene=Cvel_30438 / organism=Chromera_velia_CCMP2878 / gene_product=hypothetical protein / transcript_product=hypothetical protein / location=Cvel_scaffold4339:6749-7063(-) / protein_length=105 / sequence_SO=supercontig / SO=protein_coding / is_pseudo=false